MYGIVKGRLLIADRGDTAKLLVDRMLDGHKDQKPLTSLKEWSAREETVQPDTVAWAFARFEAAPRTRPGSVQRQKGSQPARGDSLRRLGRRASQSASSPPRSTQRPIGWR